MNNGQTYSENKPETFKEIMGFAGWAPEVINCRAGMVAFVAAMGAEAGLPCTPHCANLSLVTLFTMHLLRAIPNAGKYLEFSIEEADYYPWQYDLFVESHYTITDGKATVTDAPGWGVEINPDWLARATYQVTELEA